MNYYTYDRDEMVTVLGTDFVEEMERWLQPAEPCEHGNYARHLMPKGWSPTRQWCDGKPEPDAHNG